MHAYSSPLCVSMVVTSWARANALAPPAVSSGTTFHSMVLESSRLVAKLPHSVPPAWGMITGILGSRSLGRTALRGLQLNLADSSGLPHASHSPLPRFRALVDTALESPASALSNAVSTSTWKPGNAEWLRSKDPLESSGFRSTGIYRI